VSTRKTDRSFARRHPSTDKTSSPAWHSSPLPSQAWELSPTSHPSSSSSTGGRAHRASYTPPPHTPESQTLLLQSWDCKECGIAGTPDRFALCVTHCLNPSLVLQAITLAVSIAACAGRPTLCAIRLVRRACSPAPVLICSRVGHQQLSASRGRATWCTERS
jgi:hypothetical protein